MNKDTLFRKSSLNNISSPDQLNDYIKVANPSVWLVLAALFVLLVAVLVWSIVGSLPTTINTRAVAKEGKTICYLNIDEANAVKLGQKVSITGEKGSSYQGKIEEIGNTPMSSEEIAAALNSEYLAQALIFGPYAVKIIITTDTASFEEGGLLNVRIVTETARPIDFLLGR